jgi:hypothetical protein
VEAYLQVFLTLTEIERSPSVPAVLTLDTETSVFNGRISAGARTDVDREELSKTSYLHLSEIESHLSVNKLSSNLRYSG